MPPPMGRRGKIAVSRPRKVGDTGLYPYSVAGRPGSRALLVEAPDAETSFKGVHATIQACGACQVAPGCGVRSAAPGSGARDGEAGMGSATCLCLDVVMARQWAQQRPGWRASRTTSSTRGRPTSAAPGVWPSGQLFGPSDACRAGPYGLATRSDLPGPTPLAPGVSALAGDASMTRADVLHRLAALEAVLQGPALEAPPGPTPEDLAQCRPWSVKVGNWLCMWSTRATG